MNNQLAGKKIGEGYLSPVLALAGNPNVGKSTVFNALTGLRQHTGNWPGKTVTGARGICTCGEERYELVDLPGCYSLLAHSQEEEVARDFICFHQPDAVIVVCDATCLERNLNLVLQVIEASCKVIVCVNLMDEAEKKQIQVNIERLSKELDTPVLGITARENEGLNQIFVSLLRLKGKKQKENIVVTYPQVIENGIETLMPVVERYIEDTGEHGKTAVIRQKNIRWMCARLLDADESLLESMNQYLGFPLSEQPEVAKTLENVRRELEHKGYNKEKLGDVIAETFVKKAEAISRRVVKFEDKGYAGKDRKLDWIFTSRATGFPLMFLLLLAVFWLTISGANIPSQLLADGLFWIQDRLLDAALWAGIPAIVYEPLIFGIYRVLAWVVSVMLPPMAIFFPLFTMLEDFGYLPRVAFNLDHCFNKCRACGKQALTMCMGFGCNAAGVTGCRIIDSPRERLIAIITNNFVPCNGRFPFILSVISMFLIGSAAGFFSSFLSAVLLAGVIVLGVFMTLLVSNIMSRTVLKGVPSSFAMELPPYRRPQIGKVIVRSILDRTIFVLGRAVSVAAPAGLLIWLMANISIGDATLLNHCAGFLEPFAHLIGLDGVILLAFILGMPANEIVMPIIIMTYLAQGSLLEIDDIHVMKTLLVDNGWTWITAVSTILFSLMHWPCGTTCLTIYKETKSLKWTATAIVVPSAVGIIICFLFTAIARIIAGF